MNDEDTENVMVELSAQQKSQVEEWADDAGVSYEDAYAILLQRGMSKDTEAKHVHFEFDVNRILIVALIILSAVSVGIFSVCVIGRGLQ
jgi:hypothetical protein